MPHQLIQLTAKNGVHADQEERVGGAVQVHNALGAKALALQANNGW